jgi:diguanylate cyclase
VEEISEELAAGLKQQPQMIVATVDKLIQANRQMQQQLATADEKLREQEREIVVHVTEARTDALTGLANRRAFDDEMTRMWAEFQRQHRSFSVVMVDVDHFKKFNDSCGHQAGDEVLRGIGRVLRESKRPADQMLRYGGEEFAMILPDTSALGGAKIADAFREAIACTLFRSGSADLKVTVSMGIAQALEDENMTALVRRADAALYDAKHAGRNRVFLHDGDRGRPLHAAPLPAAPPAPPPAAAPPSAPARPTGDLETNLPLSDRTAFCLAVSRRLAEWKRSGPAPAILLVRVDQYREVVSLHGQEAGIAVQETTAHFLQSTLREMDTIGRYATRTFASLLPGIKMPDLFIVAERLREAIAQCSLPSPTGDIKFTVSFGCALPQSNDSFESILRRAEQALDYAGRQGGNATYLHNGQSYQRAPEVAGIGAR